MCKDCRLKKAETNIGVECQVLTGVKPRTYSCPPSLIEMMAQE